MFDDDFVIYCRLNRWSDKKHVVVKLFTSLIMILTLDPKEPKRHLRQPRG